MTEDVPEIALPPAEPEAQESSGRWDWLRKVAPFVTVLLFGGALWLGRFLLWNGVFLWRRGFGFWRRFRLFG